MGKELGIRRLLQWLDRRRAFELLMCYREREGRTTIGPYWRFKTARLLEVIGNTYAQKDKAKCIALRGYLSLQVVEDLVIKVFLRQ